MLRQITENDIPLEIYLKIVTYLPLKNLISAISLNTFFHSNIFSEFVLKNISPKWFQGLNTKTDYTFELNHYIETVTSINNLNLNKIKALKKLFNFIIEDDPTPLSSCGIYSRKKSYVKECKEAAITLKKIILYKENTDILSNHAAMLMQVNNSTTAQKLREIFYELVSAELIPVEAKNKLERESFTETYFSINTCVLTC